MFEDITLVCKECGKEFVFTARDQEFYAQKGYQQPKRCKECRDASKAANGEAKEAKPERPLYIGVCAKCGGEAKVRFQPREGSPIYCSECFAAMRQQGN